MDQPEVLAGLRQRGRHYLDAAAGSALAQAVAFGPVFMLASLPCCFVWLAFGATAQRLLRTERAFRIFNGAMAALLAASVILFVPVDATAACRRIPGAPSPPVPSDAQLGIERVPDGVAEKVETRTVTKRAAPGPKTTHGAWRR